jgi:hypothetical protein
MLESVTEWLWKKPQNAFYRNHRFVSSCLEIGLMQTTNWAKAPVHTMIFNIRKKTKCGRTQHMCIANLQQVTIGIYQVSMTTVNFCIFNMLSFQYFTHSFASRQYLILLVNIHSLFIFVMVLLAPINFSDVIDIWIFV